MIIKKKETYFQNIFCKSLINSVLIDSLRLAGYFSSKCIFFSTLQAICDVPIYMRVLFPARLANILSYTEPPRKSTLPNDHLPTLADLYIYINLSKGRRKFKHVPNIVTCVHQRLCYIQRPGTGLFYF